MDNTQFRCYLEAQLTQLALLTLIPKQLVQILALFAQKTQALQDTLDTPETTEPLWHLLCHELTTNPQSAQLPLASPWTCLQNLALTGRTHSCPVELKNHSRITC